MKCDRNSSYNEIKQGLRYNLKGQASNFYSSSIFTNLMIRCLIFNV